MQKLAASATPWGRPRLRPARPLPRRRRPAETGREAAEGSERAMREADDDGITSEDGEDSSGVGSEPTELDLLYTAAHQGNRPAVERRLLEADRSGDVASEARYAARMARMGGHHDIVELIADQGFSVTDDAEPSDDYEGSSGEADAEA